MATIANTHNSFGIVERIRNALPTSIRINWNKVTTTTKIKMIIITESEAEGEEEYNTLPERQHIRNALLCFWQIIRIQLVFSVLPRLPSMPRTNWTMWEMNRSNQGTAMTEKRQAIDKGKIAHTDKTNKKSKMNEWTKKAVLLCDWNDTFAYPMYTECIQALSI